MDAMSEIGVPQPDALPQRKPLEDRLGASDDEDGTQSVTNPASADSDGANTSDDRHSKRLQVAAGIAASKRATSSAQHKYKLSRHHGAAFWSSQRLDVPMYFGHQPEGPECKRFTLLDRVMELLGTITFVMLVPPVLGVLPFFVPLAGQERECTMPSESLMDEMIYDSNDDEVPGQTLPSNSTYLNGTTLLTETFPCAELRTSTFLFYTCPGW